MKLSIIVPIYNVAPYLPKCVDSLLAQDISDYEIILVDDGSPDESPEISDQYAGQYSNIKVIHQENAGLSAARNAGLAIAKGDYIMYVDSDDYLQPNVLGALLAQAERDQLDVLRFRYQNVKESGEVFVPHEGMKTDYNDYSSQSIDGLSFLNNRMWVQCYAVQFLVKREIALLELFTLGIFFEDVDWTPRMLLRAKRVASADLIVYNYLWREESITKTNDKEKVRKKLQDKFYIIQKLLTYSQQMSDKRWIEGMVAGIVVGMVSTIASTLFEERKNYIKQIKALNIFPLSCYHIVPRAKKKIYLINTSINFAIFMLRRMR